MDLGKIGKRGKRGEDKEDTMTKKFEKKSQ